MFLPKVDHLPAVTRDGERLVVEGGVIEGDASVLLQMDRYERQYRDPSEKPKDPKKKTLLDKAHDKTDALLLQHNRLVLLADQKQQELVEQMGPQHLGNAHLDILDATTIDAIQMAQAYYLDWKGGEESDLVNSKDAYACMKLSLELILEQKDVEVSEWLKISETNPTKLKESDDRSRNLHLMFASSEDEVYEQEQLVKNHKKSIKKLNNDKSDPEFMLEELDEKEERLNAQIERLEKKIKNKSWKRFFCGWGEKDRIAREGLRRQELGERKADLLVMQAQRKGYEAEIKRIDGKIRKFKRKIKDARFAKDFYEHQAILIKILLGGDLSRREYKSMRVGLIQGAIEQYVQPVEAELEVIESLRQRTMVSINDILAKTGIYENKTGPFDRHFAEKALKSAMKKALMLE